MSGAWTALTRCVADGRLGLDNNPGRARLARRPPLAAIIISLPGFPDAAARRAAAMYSFIETAKLNGVTLSYLADVLARMPPTTPATRVAELLVLWNWQTSPISFARCLSA